MSKIKILFLIADLGGGGAERVLVNLVNALPPEKYDITIRTIFGKGVNAKFLNDNINYIPKFNIKPFSGYTKIQKIFSPRLLYRLLIPKTKQYDVEIAFMHHVPTRILAGSDSTAKKFAWVHSKCPAYGVYRNFAEFKNCYGKFDGVAFVAKNALDAFKETYKFPIKSLVVHNLVDNEKIISSAKELCEIPSKDTFNLCSVGRLSSEKGFDRLLRALGPLNKKGINGWHFYLLGDGGQLEYLKNIAKSEGIENRISFLGYDLNPHKYVSKMDLFVCSSYTEGYSTAVTESIIVGTPVLTTDCSGMSEILGDNGAGLIVPNDDQSLYEGLKDLLTHPDKIKKMKIAAKERSKAFSKENSIREFEDFIGTRE